MDVSVFDESFKTATDLSAKTGYFAKMSADMTVALCGDGGKAVGVIQNDPVSGSAAVVRMMGRTSVVVGEAIDFGDKIASDADGKAATAATGDHVLGLALTTSDGTAAQPMVDIFMYPCGAPLP
jgi:hypothetical protein